MQKFTKVMALVAILGASMIGTGQAFAETSVSSDIQYVELLAVGAAIIGALLAVGQGIADRPKDQPISIRKTLSAVITAITASMLIVNLGALPDQIAGMSLVGIAIMFLMIGYGGDKALAKLDK